MGSTRKPASEVANHPPPQPEKPAVDPKQIKADATEGDVMLRLGDYDSALSAYQRGLRLDPSNADLRQKFESAKRACVNERKIQGNASKCEPQ
jgi:small glutamine-rich tetratricopeptide repeat-containing protein alpha